MRHGIGRRCCQVQVGVCKKWASPPFASESRMLNNIPTPYIRCRVEKLQEYNSPIFANNGVAEACANKNPSNTEQEHSNSTPSTLNTIKTPSTSPPSTMTYTMHNSHHRFINSLIRHDDGHSISQNPISTTVQLSYKRCPPNLSC